jgi:hypothetical protein
MAPHLANYDSYTLIDDNGPEVIEHFNTFVRAFEPATPIEQTYIEWAALSALNYSRVMQVLNSITSEQIRTSCLRFCMDQEDEIQQHIDRMQATPGWAVACLERTALGCRYLIERLQRLQLLLAENYTVLGRDRQELIRLQGAKSEPGPDGVFESAAAFLVWAYTLGTQQSVTSADFQKLGAARPEAMLIWHETEWVPSTPLIAHEFLMQLVSDRLVWLQEREAHLRVTYEEPALAAAEIRSRVLQDPEARELLRIASKHRQEFDQAVRAFASGRKQALKTGFLPGMHPEVGAMKGAQVQKPVDVPPGAAAAAAATIESARQARKAAAARAARGATCPIGPRDFTIDAWKREIYYHNRAAGEIRPDGTPFDSPPAPAARWSKASPNGAGDMTRNGQTYKPQTYEERYHKENPDELL